MIHALIDFAQGYVLRQALYACSTCIKDDMEPAGICLACSLDCHDGHELVELYTKRYANMGKLVPRCELQQPTALK